ncbi:inactive C-alpha-formylglycine-generating enzyme 2 isoform X2 [Chelonoidis abingdonii]|uniref:inactive C-alpha-formylglycine-generating enzyme 2 isoform X2 n=1 Tax=Chelonoidis abingdonii TaxID=106734 RepID=UPI0013F29698|nr:inactive C-alpha-formylglycine-generating enzyme 2 isoform X2 [Chelonoidis abingdonii]
MLPCSSAGRVQLAFLLGTCVLGSSYSLQVFEDDGNMVQLPGGKFQMGTNSPDGKNEGPLEVVTVKSFAIDKYPVTNRDFREFVREKKYKTEAEAFGWSFVFEDFVSEELKKKVTQKLESAPWWLPIDNAFWRQGIFPKVDMAEDGYHGVSPVNAFSPQNNYGLYDLLGNTWEWTASEYQPHGPMSRQRAQKMHVLRGASWIDTVDGSANHKARVTTRMGNTPDSASDNLGFRCAGHILSQKSRKTESKKEL